LTYKQRLLTFIFINPAYFIAIFKHLITSNFKMLKRTALLICTLTVFLVSCTTKTIPAEERAIERWKALIAQDWEKAYTFATPNYRKTYSAKAFRNNYGSAVEWKEVKLLSSKLTNDNITDVKLEVKYTFAEGGANLLLPSVIDERWQLINKTWWHVKK